MFSIPTHTDSCLLLYGRLGWAGGVLKAPYPYSEGVPANMTEAQYVDYCLWYLGTHIPEYLVPPENIAAILIEPGLAEGGNWIPTQAFIQGIRRLCDKHGWLMIADEVLTGLGRTGKLWSVQHYDVVPDILVAGKNLSGGIEPCAGVAARDDILGDNPRASGGSTFAGTPAGCAATPKTLEIYERDNIVASAAHLGEVAAKRNGGLGGPLPHRRPSAHLGLADGRLLQGARRAGGRHALGPLRARRNAQARRLGDLRIRAASAHAQRRGGVLRWHHRTGQGFFHFWEKVVIFVTGQRGLREADCQLCDPRSLGGA